MAALFPAAGVIDWLFDLEGTFYIGASANCQQWNIEAANQFSW